MFFVASKIFWIVFRPLTILLILLIAGLGLRRLGWRRLGGGVVGLSLIALVTAEYTTIGALLLVPLENRFPAVDTLPADVTGIIILGGAVQAGAAAEARNQVLLNGSAERMTEAVVLARRLPRARLAFTGFSGDLFPEGWSEADLAQRFFSAMGIPAGRVVYEAASRNTAENAAFLKAMVTPRPGQTWLLVTSARHMPRSVGCFRQVGWEVVPYPVDFILPPAPSLRLTAGGGLGVVGTAMREWVGLLAYWLTDRTNSLFPAPVGRAGQAVV